MRPATAAALSFALISTMGAEGAWSSGIQAVTRVSDAMLTPVATTKHTRKTVTRKTVRHRTIHHRSAASAQSSKGKDATTNK